MARLTSELVLSLVDKVSRPARQAAQSIRGISRAVAEGNGANLRAMAAANARNIGVLRGQLLNTAVVAVGLGVALAAPMGPAMEFESVLTDIAQKADLTREKAAALGRQIRALGPATNKSTIELAKGVDILAGFGLDPASATRMIAPIGRAATAYKAEVEDLSRASFSAFDNLKVPIGQTGKALDVMAQAGKDGAFELKDMATYFPSITASAQAMGQRGTGAVADLAAALQITRKGAADAAEAATNLSNLQQKIYAPATVRKFAKMGVNLRREMKKMTDAGISPIEAISKLTNKTLGGDLSRIGNLFEDAQVQKALRPLIQNMEEYRKIRERAAGASGVVNADYLERLKNGEAGTKALANATQNLAVQFGTTLMPMFAAAGRVLTPILNAIGALVERFPGLTRGIVGAVVALVAFRLASLSFKLAKAHLLGGLIQMALGFLDVKNKALSAGLTTKLFLGGLKAGGLKGFATALLGMLNPMALVRGSLMLTKLAFKGLLVGSGIGILLLAAGWIIEHWSGVKTFFAGFARGFMTAIAPLRPALEPLIGAVKRVAGWIGKLIGKGGKYDWTEWGVRAGAAVGNFVVGAVGFVKSLVDWFKKAVDLAWKLAKWTPAGLVIQAGVAVAKAAGAGRPKGRARGGHMAAGGLYQINEDGAEIFRPGRSGTMLPNRELRRLQGAGGGQGRPSVFAPRIIVTSNAADPEAVAALVMARIRAEYRRMTAGVFADGAYA